MEARFFTEHPPVREFPMGFSDFNKKPDRTFQTRPPVHPVFNELIGMCPALKKVYDLISKVACSDSTVLLLGETGTGKEVMAKALHQASARKDKIMVKVNCAALPVNLIESELFGHERGSFTGATDRRIGKFEMAHHGTLFLDEIGEMPVDLQVKLLRAIQEREFERVGGKSTIKVDVRIIAATNRDLQKDVDDGKFRSDLFFRLNVFPIYIPPLRERKEDIPELAEYFLKRYAKIFGRNITGISRKAREKLCDYSWPGNVRELEHLIERSILLSNENILRDICLPAKQQKVNEENPDDSYIKTIHENERDHIIRTIRKCRGKISGVGGAAGKLGINPSTLNSRIKKLAITREQIFSGYA